MALGSDPDVTQAPVRWRRARRVVVAVLFAAALAERVSHITQPPLEFHPNRQYRSALLARGFYLQLDASAPEWRRRVAATQRRVFGALEPPALEWIVALGYRLIGGEYLWLPRMLCSVIWLVGGVFLYRTARRLTSPDAAVVSLCYYLLLPFAVSASRSFQPDSLMVMLSLLSVLLIVRYDERPSLGRALAAGAAACGAIAVKPVCVFVLLGAFGALAVRRHGLYRWLARPRSLVFLAAALLPSAAYYVHGIFFGGMLGEQAGASFLPRLLGRADFWRGWLNGVLAVVGAVPLVAGMVGTALFCRGMPRALMLGLWLGYALFGLVFTYHIHTHDYYQLILIPIVALSLAPIGQAAARRLRQLGGGWYTRILLAGALVSALALSRLLTPYSIDRKYEREVAVAGEIGSTVGHSSRTILLAYHYGKAVMYHGEVAGKDWPALADLPTYDLQGRKPLSFERLDQMLRRNEADYFIVTDLAELDRQEDLRRVLARRCRILARTDDYVIFDLRRRAVATKSASAPARVGNMPAH